MGIWNLLPARMDIVREPVSKSAPFERFFERSPDVFCVLDPGGRFLRLNRAVEHLLGLTRQEVLARPVADFVHADERTAMHHALARLAQGASGVEFECRILARDGAYRWMGWNLQAVPEEVALYATARDITAAKEAAEAMRMAKERAEAANRTKSTFLANMSHELRTPLNSIIGFTRLMAKNKPGNLNPKDLNYLERVKLNGEHLLYLINQVLDLSKIEAGCLKLDPTPVDLAELIRTTVATLEGQVQNRPVVLEADIQDGLDPVVTDRQKLQQVLINLIGNALKFTDEGQVTVKLREKCNPRRWVRIDVVDTGIGIAEDKLETIFEAFKQADDGKDRKYEGTGLGLAISRALCQKMGYELTVRSKLGQGSVFSLHLRHDLVRPKSALMPLPGERP